VPDTKPDTNIELDAVEASVFRDMSRDGCSASAALQKTAFVKWMASGYESGYSDLAARMQREIPTESDTQYPYHRIADALVQKLRKFGLVKRNGVKWSLTDNGQLMLEKVG
jgi:hypothetical protein